jgi:inorganic pyrophosphatase
LTTERFVRLRGLYLLGKGLKSIRRSIGGINVIDSLEVRKKSLLERIHKLESFIYSEHDTEELKKIYKDHLDYLRQEYKKCEEE